MTTVSIFQRSITAASGVWKASSTYLVSKPKSKEMASAADQPLQAALDSNRYV